MEDTLLNLSSLELESDSTLATRSYGFAREGCFKAGTRGHRRQDNQRFRALVLEVEDVLFVLPLAVYLAEVVLLLGKYQFGTLLFLLGVEWHCYADQGKE